MTTLIDRLEHQLATPNLGVADCLVRIALGLLLTALAADGSVGAWGYALGLLAIGTGATWVCPAYKLLGISTARA